MHRSLFVSVLLIALALPPAALGGGGDPPVSAGSGIVHIRSKAPYFHGHVGAEVPNCQGPRKVKLYERQKDGDRKLRGKTVSTGYEFDGVWEIPIEPEPGAYFAAAPKFRTIDDGTGNEVVCGRAKSRTVTLD